MNVALPRKLRKLFRSPGKFVADARHKHWPHPIRLPFIPAPKPRVFVFGLSPWKEFLAPFFPGNQLIYINRHIDKAEFEKTWARRIGRRPSDKMLIWGFKAPAFVTRFVDQRNVPLLFVEDGFLRSIELGASKAPPFSLCIDSRTPHFDARSPSDLETLLLRHDFTGDPASFDGVVHAIEAAQKGRLAATGWANHGDDFVAGDIQGHFADGMIVAVEDI